jgi:hypothetical protein
MFLVGYIAAPPTIGFWAAAGTATTAKAAAISAKGLLESIE